MYNQVYVFLIFIMNGLLIGLLFDTFRTIRKSFKTSNIVTDFQDILFWLLTGLLILYSLFKFANGELRGYIFIGLILGYILYLLIFSSIYMKISLTIINLLKTVLYYILIKPSSLIISFIKRFIVSPIITFFSKLYKTLSKFIKNKTKKHKNIEVEKDFAWICRII